MDFQGLVEKVKKCAFLIDENKFDELTSDTGYVDSFVYMFAASLIMLVLNTVVGVIRAVLTPPSFLVSTAELVITVLVTSVIAWVASFFIFYIWAGISQFLLKLLGGQGSFLKTVQVFIYGNTPSYLFGWIPCVGLIAYLIALANVTIGIKRVHNISLFKAALVTIIIPLGIAIIIGILVVMFFTASVATMTALPMSS